MKVAVLNTEFHRGGAARAARLISNAIETADDDIEQTIFHAGKRSENENEVVIRRYELRYLSALAFRVFGDASRLDFGASARLSQALEQFDLLHVHNLHGYYIGVFELLEHLSMPIVWTWHDMWGATGRCAYAEACDAWETGCGNCPRLSAAPASWIDNTQESYSKKSELLVRRKNLRIACPSDWLSRIALSRGYLNVSTIPNPLSTESITSMTKKEAKEALKLPTDKPALLFVAADCSDPRKGYDSFLGLLNKVDARGIAIGSNAKPHERIQRIGPISDTRLLATYFRASDAYIITSTSDNYPNTVIEAISNGTPVFGLNCGGVSEQLPNWWDGLADSPVELSEKVRNWLLKGSESNSDLSCKFSEYAHRQWAPDRIARRYIDLYQQSIDQRNAASILDGEAAR